MQYISKKAQGQKQTEVSNPGLAGPYFQKARDQFGGGLPLNHPIMQQEQQEQQDQDGSATPGMPVAPMVDPVQAKHNALITAQNLLSQIAQRISNSHAGEALGADPLLSELEQAIGATAVGGEAGNTILLEQFGLLKGIYESNPNDAVEGIRRLITQMSDNIQRLLENTQYSVAANNISSAALIKNANLKEEVRQHFNNFAVSDIQIINKLQFLTSMVDIKGSPVEEPVEYTRPKLGNESEQFTVLHGTGGIGEKKTNADIKKEIKSLRGVLSDRGYSNEEIDECVAVINTNQRSQLDVTDESDLGTRAEVGYSDKERELMKGIVRGNEQIMPNEKESRSKTYFSKKAQNRFVGDFDLQRIGDFLYKVKRDDGEPLNGDDERRIEGILLGRGYENIGIDLVAPEADGYYLVHIGYPAKQHDRDESSDVLSGNAHGITKKAARATEWWPDIDSPEPYYLNPDNNSFDRVSIYGLTFLLRDGLPEKVKYTSDGNYPGPEIIATEILPAPVDVMRVLSEADMQTTPAGKYIESVVVGHTKDADGFAIVAPHHRDLYPEELAGGVETMASTEKIAEISGLSVGPTMGGTVWCPKTKQPVEEYLCWSICMEGIAVGEKVVCGKRLFDGLVADNNERALRRMTTFAHDNPDSKIPGPNFRIPDDERRVAISDEEIPTERRLEELQNKYHVPSETDKWTHSPTLSDDKKHDWSQKVKIASKTLLKKAQEDDSYPAFLQQREREVAEQGGSFQNAVDKILATIPVDVSGRTVDVRKLVDAVDSAVGLIHSQYAQEASIAMQYLAERLVETALRHIDAGMAKQIIYNLISTHPSLSVLRDSSLGERRAQRRTYQFPQDADRHFTEVTEPRRRQLMKYTDESYGDYAERLIDIISNENPDSWTPEEAASMLAYAIPYPTNKQFITAMSLIRDFMKRTFGENSMYFVATKWANDIWQTSDALKPTNIKARQHLKVHFPEVIEIYNDFHPQYPNGMGEYDDDDLAAIDRISEDFPWKDPNEFPVV